MAESLRARLRRCLARARDAEAGLSSVEFALIAPVLIVIMAGIADVGDLLVSRSDVSSAVSAGSNFLLVNAGRVAEAPEEVARQTAAVAANRLPGGGVVRVIVNGDLTVVNRDGRFSTEGSAASAARCFCATPSGTAMSFGSALECGRPCGTGGYASRYVQIVVSRSFEPKFGGLLLVSSGDSITVDSTVSVP
ncbi:TadE/TadG family type IV pilus assembly protein [Aquibium microcysteis]|uniref:TadE/TadG family type IV pilus assembly protein n=1 Tax=Aquibium microcysteis TaxID=675281 RepID=UPI00165D246B|nr:TadE family protein [Aquibium microcysteis]